MELLQLVVRNHAMCLTQMQIFFSALMAIGFLQRTQVLSRFRCAPAAALLCTDVAARGLDIPDVHWVFQFDPPQDPAQFVHRCGRTARMGRSGHALVLLAHHEDSYVALLANRGIPMAEATPLATAVDGASEARCLAERDRDVMEKGTRAFVAHVRGYKEHQCKFIFRLQELDLCQLGRMFGLLRLPVMKEV
jgi:ATP-dependent RNA helicase DDX55/SPB4